MDPAAVLRIARLAKLELDGAELDRTARDLSALLRDIEKLRSLEAPDAPARISVTAAPTPSTEPESLHMPVSYLAPEWRSGFFTVPRSAAGRAAERDR